MKNTTLLFLIKKDGDTITDVCLAMKKRGFGIGRYNGVGGKVELTESIEGGAIREAKEEIGVDVLVLSLCATLNFTFLDNSAWNQLVHVYLTDSWEGEPSEGEEMNPKWFSVKDIPYTTMWPDDIYWLPSVLEGKLVRGRFTFSEGDTIIENEVTVI